MRESALLLSMCLVLSCTSCSAPPQSKVGLPAGWTVVESPAPESDGAQCANAAVDDTWTVALGPDSLAPTIRLAGKESFTDSVVVPGGRLTAENRGEFGGDVWWEPAAGVREHVAETNLVVFVPTRDALLGLVGLAHMSTNQGKLVRFDRVAAGWRMIDVMELGFAPLAVTRLAADSLLVVTSGALLVIHPPDTRRVVHRNEVWNYTYPTSVVRSRSGVVYVGMRAAVARLRRGQGGYTEDWLVPATCSQRWKLKNLGDCTCVLARGLRAFE